jgi:hypothetical protein
MMTLPHDDLDDRVAALERLAPDVSPVFYHLFATLPNPGEDFPADKRITFLRAVSAVADLVYGLQPLAISVQEETKR